MNTLICSANSLLFSARYSSRYFPLAANELEVSPIGLLSCLGIKWIDWTHNMHVFLISKICILRSPKSTGMYTNGKNIFYLLFIPVIITPVSVSHDPSEINLIYWFGVQETFLIIINFKNSCAA